MNFIIYNQNLFSHIFTDNYKLYKSYYKFAIVPKVINGKGQFIYVPKLVIIEHRLMHRVLLHKTHKKRFFFYTPITCSEKDLLLNNKKFVSKNIAKYIRELKRLFV